MRAAATFQRYRNIDDQAEQLTGFDQAYQQLDRGTYAGAFLACDSDEVGFFVEGTNRRLSQQGAGPSDVISAVVLLSALGPTVTNGSAFTMDDVLLVGPGGAYEAVINAGDEPAVFSISLDAAVALPLRRLSSQQAGRVRRVADPELSKRFRAAAANALRSWDADSQSISVPRSVVHALMLELLTAPSAIDGSSHSSIQIYRAARDAMVNALTKSPSMSEIAARVGTSRRTLEHAFDTCVGVSPARFHKLLRLNSARRLLENGQHSVHHAATSSGLHHLGRFSGDYRDLFGELPSDTARRARVLITDTAVAGT
ncbi:MAG: AraC family transcriptional regulator [Acidimicrobiaceae bacterium]|nr:AraC family transcriptional regulator [Acidimicrobiaceae bacterium]